jgi:hypothetical protein
MIHLTADDATDICKGGERVLEVNANQVRGKKKKTRL